MKDKYKLDKTEYKKVNMDASNDLDAALSALEKRLDSEKTEPQNLAHQDTHALIDPSTWHKRVVVITGASSGLGFVTSHCFSLYADIVYNLSLEKGEDDNINFIETDMSNPDSVKESLRKVYNKEGQIDILINNAAVSLFGATEELLTSDITKVMNINMLGVITACQTVIPFMRDQRHGLIMNMTCTPASSAPAFNGVYAATKKAIETFSLATKKELATLKVNVIAVSLPYMTTNFTENRIKQESTNKAYKYKISNDIGRLEYAEQTGIAPEIIAAELYKLSNKKSFGNNVIHLTGKNKIQNIFGVFAKK